VESGVDSEPARGQAVLLFTADGTEVARAQKRHDVVVPVGMEVEAETCEAQVSRQRLGVDAALSQVEHVGAVADRSGLRVDDLVHSNRRAEGPAQMKEPDLKADIRSDPEGSLRTKADRLVSIPLELSEGVR